MDGEPPGLDEATLDTHLAGCPACRAWLEAARQVTRQARIGVARPVPDRTTALLAAIDRDRQARRKRAMIPTRGLLAALAVALVTLCVPVLLLGHDRAAPLHVSHELGSFDLAIAAGFLAAAWRPHRARGMLALVGVATLALIGTAALDLAAGRTTLTDEAPHLLVGLGWLLLYRLHRRYTATPNDPAAQATPPVAGAPSVVETPDTTDNPHGWPVDPGRAHPWLDGAGGVQATVQ
jgi:predicted anti-sigma-YlaC factor YlaD